MDFVGISFNEDQRLQELLFLGVFILILFICRPFKIEVENCAYSFWFLYFLIFRVVCSTYHVLRY